jgi:hypothetical protein
MRQELHRCDLKRQKQITRGTLGGQQTMTQDQSGEKRDEPTGTRAGDDAPPAILATCKKTTYPDTYGDDHDTDEPLPLCSKQSGGSRLAPRNVDQEKQL